MSFKSNYCVNHSLCFLNRNLSFLGPTYPFRVWRRRRRLKFEPKLSVVTNQLLGPLIVSPQFENLFNNLISHFPSVNSLDLIAPALGLASGVVLYLSNSDRNYFEFSHTGEWVLFTTPTPFNRFVMLRCPSILFQGSELLEDINEKLVKEERHFVKLDNRRRRRRTYEQTLNYQRVCITSTDDGGVVSLDWPASLNMTEDRGMDTTLLLVPGTTEGSMDKNVRSFVCDALKRGCFPIVMNPRGCADSPLTTPR